MPRLVAVLACAVVFMVSACATAIAPSGKLRAGVYTGSPTSYLPPEGGRPARGVAYEMAAALAEEAGVAFEPRIFPSNDKLLEAFRAGELDLILTNATSARAQFIDFGPTVLEVEKGYLVRPGFSGDASAIDRPGVRVGVSGGSSSETELAQVLKSATRVPMPSLAEASRALAEGRIDAFGTNKAILFEMADRLPGSRVVGNWGAEAIAFGVPKGRPEALAYLTRFVQDEKNRARVRAAAERAGLRGLRP